MNVIQVVYEIRGVIDSVRSSMELLFALTTVIELTPISFNAQILPTTDGKGGTGITAQIGFVESYATVDSWPENQYIHLNIVSCKLFDKKKVFDFLKDTYLEVKETVVFSYEENE